jgi:hypothetical protein
VRAIEEQERRAASKDGVDPKVKALADEVAFESAPVVMAQIGKAAAGTEEHFREIKRLRGKLFQVCAFRRGAVEALSPVEIIDDEWRRYERVRLGGWARRKVAIRSHILEI